MPGRASSIRSRPRSAKATARRLPSRSTTTGVPRTRLRFSERFECRTCAIPYEVPQPRLFSFNNPFGACQRCHGFGNIIELDMALVVPDASKTMRTAPSSPGPSRTIGPASPS